MEAREEQVAFVRTELQEFGDVAQPPRKHVSVADEVLEIAALECAREDQIVVVDQFLEEGIGPARLDVEEHVEKGRKVRRRVERRKVAADAAGDCDFGSLVLDRTV